MAKTILTLLAIMSAAYGKHIGKNWVNLTVYRKTPINYTHTVTNMNTGDAGGDMWFGLYTLLRNVIEHSRVPILNIPGYNVYSKYIISVDPRLGVYSECNPSSYTGVFSCETNGHLGCATGHDRGCWNDCKGYQKSLGNVCPADECSCDFLEHYAVGFERTASVFGALEAAQRLAKQQTKKAKKSSKGFLRGDPKHRKDTLGGGVRPRYQIPKNTHGVASGQKGDYYDCAVAVQKVCSQYRFHDPENCMSCVKADQHKSGSVITKAGCTPLNIAKACGASTEDNCDTEQEKNECREPKSTESPLQCFKRCSKIPAINQACSQEEINEGCDYNPAEICQTMGGEECPFWPYNTAEKCLACMHNNKDIRSSCPDPYIDSYCGVSGGSQQGCNVQLASLDKPCKGFGLPGLCTACVQEQKNAHNCSDPEVQAFCDYSPEKQCKGAATIAYTYFCGYQIEEYEYRISTCILCAFEKQSADMVFGSGPGKGGCTSAHSGSRSGEGDDNSIWTACDVEYNEDSRDAVCEAVLLDTCIRPSDEEQNMNHTNCLACAGDPKNKDKIFGSGSATALQGNCTESTVLQYCGASQICESTVAGLCGGRSRGEARCIECALSAANHEIVFGHDVLHGQANCTLNAVYAACDYDPENQCREALELTQCDRGGYECVECAREKKNHKEIFGKNITAGEGNCTEELVDDYCDWSPERQCFNAINKVCITDDNSTKCVMCANLEKFHKQVFGHNITAGEGECTQDLIYSACGLEQPKVCTANVQRLCCYDSAHQRRTPVDCVKCVSSLTGYDKELVFGPNLLHGQGNCSEEQVETSCGYEPPPVEPEAKVQYWTNTLAQRLNGSWYSTRSEGECNATKHTDCWWTLAANPRNVNTTCVHTHVLNATYNLRPKCFEACPDPKRSIYSVCPLSCMLETLVGNVTSGVPGMDKNAILKPFLDAFKDEKQGGCPEIPVYY